MKFSNIPKCDGIAMDGYYIKLLTRIRHHTQTYIFSATRVETTEEPEATLPPGNVDAEI